MDRTLLQPASYDTFETEVLFTPALTKRALAYATTAQFGLQLARGDAAFAAPALPFRRVPGVVL